jgi:hypothetical protein
LMPARGRFIDTESSVRRRTITGSFELANVARCTKGISFAPARRMRDESCVYGTNFRHAVEFSRSGRTPSGPFRDDRGQPEIRYLVGSAGSNTPSTAQSPTWSGPRWISRLVLGGSSARRSDRSKRPIAAPSREQRQH